MSSELTEKQAAEFAAAYRVMDDADLVLAVWPDETREAGIDVLVLYGTYLLRQRFGSNPLLPLHAAVELVHDRDAAWKAREMYDEATFGAGPEPS